MTGQPWMTLDSARGMGYKRQGEDVRARVASFLRPEPPDSEDRPQVNKSEGPAGGTVPSEDDSYTGAGSLAYAPPGGPSMTYTHADPSQIGPAIETPMQAHLNGRFAGVDQRVPASETGTWLARNAGHRNLELPDEPGPLKIERTPSAGHTAEGDEIPGGGGFVMNGGPRSRASEYAADEFVNSQVQTSARAEARLAAQKAAELEQQRALAAQARAMDEAAMKANFERMTGIPYSDKAVEEFLKHEADSANAQGLAADMAKLDKMEQAELLAPKAGEDATVIRQRYKDKRDLRLRAYAATQHVSPGGNFSSGQTPFGF